MSRTCRDLKPIENCIQSMRDPALLHLLKFFARNSYAYAVNDGICMETAAVGMQTYYAEQFTPLDLSVLVPGCTMLVTSDHSAEKIGLRNVHRAHPMEGYLIR